MVNSIDPDFSRLRTEFLTHVRELHGQYAFIADPLTFAAAIGLPVIAGTRNLYTLYAGKPILQFNAIETPTRRNFSLWHEISHHLFQTADDGFQALLEEKHGRSTKLSRDLEESLCNESAAVLQMPDSHVQAALRKYGFDPRTAVALSDTCGSSIEASLRRISDSFDIDSWVLLAKADGLVIYSHTRTKYPIRVDSRIPADHVIYEVLDCPGLLEKRAVMPYAGCSPRTPHRTLRAIGHKHRIIGVIAEKFPPQRDPSVVGLFDI